MQARPLTGHRQRVTSADTVVVYSLAGRFNPANHELPNQPNQKCHDTLHCEYDDLKDIQHQKEDHLQKTEANSHHYLFLFQKEDRWDGGGAGGGRRVKTNQHKLVHKKCEKIHTNFQNKPAKPQEAVEMHGFINWFRRKPTTTKFTNM